MVLLAPELRSITVCLGSAAGELGPIDIAHGLILGKLYGFARASATA